MRTKLVLIGVCSLVTTAVAVLTASPAQAHPLGNFSVNEYVGLVIHPDRLTATAVVDVAEIPTLQDRPSVDTDGNGTVTAAEQAVHAAATCQALAAAVPVDVDGRTASWTVVASTYDYSPGAGGLAVSRLACSLTAPATVDRRAIVNVVNHYLADRVGWRELTAQGDRIRLVSSPLPSSSVSHELRDYPKDLLSSALDIRSGRLEVEPGTGGPATGVASSPTGADPLTRAVAGLDRRFTALAGGPHLTPWVGLLAVLLALVLGAGHAALPGHGKTVLAAYLAGRQGRPRDALVVAGSVTLAHTGAVLGVGLLLTAGTAFAGEQVLGWLGLLSGAVVVTVGVGMLAGVLRGRSHRADHGHSHAHRPGHGHSHGPWPAGGHRLAHSHGDGHEHGDQHGQGHGDGHGHVGDLRSEHDHDPDGGSEHGPAPRTDSGGRARRRWGLAGIGLAGGLVPSPSALVVLLGAIGLGRTGFGIVLVLAYGLGMAAALTGAGLLLVAVQRRFTGRALTGRLANIGRQVSTAAPTVTAALVVVVGAGMALRAAVVL